jgi:hypothetical protein
MIAQLRAAKLLLGDYLAECGFTLFWALASDELLAQKLAIVSHTFPPMAEEVVITGDNALQTKEKT